MARGGANRIGESKSFRDRSPLGHPDLVCKIPENGVRSTVEIPWQNEQSTLEAVLTLLFTA